MDEIYNIGAASAVPTANGPYTENQTAASYGVSGGQQGQSSSAYFFEGLAQGGQSVMQGLGSLQYLANSLSAMLGPRLQAYAPTAQQANDAKKILSAFQTLGSDKETPAKRLQSVLTLSEKLTPGGLSTVLKTYGSSVPAATEFLGLLDTLQAAEGSVDQVFTQSARLLTAMQKIDPDYARKLRLIRGPLSLVSNVSTLTSDKASDLDKTKAMASFAVSSIRSYEDLKNLDRLVQYVGLDKAAYTPILSAVQQNVPGILLEGAVEAPLSIVRGLPSESVEGILELAKDPATRARLNLLFEKTAGDPALGQGVQNLFASLAEETPLARKNAIALASSLDTLVLRDSLGNLALRGDDLGLSALREIARGADAGTVKALGGLLGDFNTAGLSRFAQLSSLSDTQTAARLAAYARNLGVPADVFSSALDASFGILDFVSARTGVRASAELGERFLRGFAKLLPGIGAVPAALDVAAMAELASTAREPELRYFAELAGSLAGLDAVSSVAEVLALGAPPSVALDLGLGGSQLALAFYITGIEQQIAAGNFVPSDEMRAIIGATSLAIPGAGLSMLLRNFGAEGSIEVLRATGRVAWEYGDMAIESLEQVLISGGALAGQAYDALGQLAAEGRYQLDRLQGFFGRQFDSLGALVTGS